MEAYFNDWTVFSLLQHHIECLRLMLDKWRKCKISMNLKKCIFFSPFGVFLGHIVCKQGLLVDPSKIAIIVDIPPLLQSNSCAFHWDIMGTIGSSLKSMHGSKNPWIICWRKNVNCNGQNNASRASTHWNKKWLLGLSWFSQIGVRRFMCMLMHLLLH
jgi:hypothetical protein